MRSSRRRLDACNGRDGQNEVAKREIGDARADAAKIEGEATTKLSRNTPFQYGNAP